MRRHPNEATLATWLGGGTEDRVGRHVEQCEECSATCERLTAVADRLHIALRGALSPDDGLEKRVLQRVTTTLRERETAESFLDLFGIGVETARVVFGEEETS